MNGFCGVNGFNGNYKIYIEVLGNRERALRMAHRPLQVRLLGGHNEEKKNSCDVHHEVLGKVGLRKPQPIVGSTPAVGTKKKEKNGL